jgi:hypothetical protein
MLAARQSGDGNRLLLGGLTARFWDAGDRAPWERVLEVPGLVYSVAWSADGKVCAVGGGREGAAGTARVWDAWGRPLTEALPHPALVQTVALGQKNPFDPDARLLATGCDDGRVRLWITQNANKPMLELPPHLDKVYGVAFSPDGRFLLTASRDRFVCLWDATTPAFRLLARCEHPNAALCGAFSADGRRFVTGYAGGAFLWEWGTETKPEQRAVFPHFSGILHVDINRQGSTVVTGGTDGLVYWWDAATGRRLAPPWRHEGLVRAANFDYSGQALLTASTTLSRGGAYLWTLPVPLQEEPGRLRTWAEVVSGFEMRDEVMGVPSHEAWKKKWDRLGQLPALENLLGKERRARAPSTAPAAGQPRPVPIATEAGPAATNRPPENPANGGVSSLFIDIITLRKLFQLANGWK